MRFTSFHDVSIDATDRDQRLQRETSWAQIFLSACAPGRTSASPLIKVYHREQTLIIISGQGGGPPIKLFLFALGEAPCLMPIAAHFFVPRPVAEPRFPVIEAPFSKL
jgi:hypothetical protein